jgi:hypothetical protein
MMTGRVFHEKGQRLKSNLASVNDELHYYRLQLDRFIQVGMSTGAGSG